MKNGAAGDERHHFCRNQNFVLDYAHRNCDGGDDVLCFQGIYADYGTGDDAVHALADASLSAGQGEVLALIGPSGCGKSTLLRVGAGLLHPKAGTVLADGIPIDQRTLRIGFLPQNYGLLAWKTVRENILLSTEVKGEWNEERASVFEELVKDLGLTFLLNRYPHELSGGQQQRVGLARVFLLAPDLLLMDEPFSALDVITRESMQAVFLVLWKKRSVTTLLVTHYVEEALTLAGRIAVMTGTPGHVAEIIDNRFAGNLAQRSTREFFAMGQRLRARIAGAGV